MRRLAGPLAVALAGMVALLALFPRWDPSARLGAVLDRSAAIAKTRQFALAHGVDAGGWGAVAAETLESPKGPLKIRVILLAPGGKSLEAEWLPNGGLASSRLPDAPKPAVPAAVKVTDNGDGGVHVQVVAEDVTPAKKLVYTAVRVVEAVWRFAVFCCFCVAAVRRRIRYRVALILTAVVAVSTVASYWGGSGRQHSRMPSTAQVEVTSDASSGDAYRAGYAAGRRSSAESEPALLGAAFWVFVFTAVGYSLRAAGNRQKWASIEMAASGGWFSRQVGWSVSAGLLSGIGIAALPYLMAAAGAAGGSGMVFRMAPVLAAPVPALAAWELSPGVLAVGLFGFSLPLAGRVRRGWLRWALTGALGICVIGANSVPFGSRTANLAAGAVVFGGYLLLYLRVDLLATMAAMVASHAAVGSCLLLAQPTGPARALAGPLLLIWVAGLAAAMNFAVRGREGIEPPSPPSLEPAEERETQSGRMRLEAEFAVARKAQEGALPAAPPELPGYSLAGSCQPARQVGGDLYDFFPLADGRLGIVVADVSGKGVPAALYMMVTKGLLAATTRESSDLRYILQQINLHLYRACRKKVFVTLAAAALDPERRRLQHGRAGHNPILWRRAALRETVLLKPAGLALGMTPGERFNRLLEIEELELQPGDAVVLYSDGITEAVDARMEQFGEPRLIRAVEATDGRPADQSRAAILGHLAEFVGSTPARDDITLVVLRVAGNGMLI